MALVLIVDDSPTEVHVLTNVLEKHGFDTISADNGTQGIEAARRQNPNIILMDVVMPGINGFQATRKLARDPETSAIPVIMVTTKDQESDKVWGMRQGAFDYLIKPVAEDDLIDKVRAALAHDS
ncbi:MAG: response regulator [Pseudomonadota bacterium]